MNYIVFDLEWNIAGRANKVDPAIQAAMPHEIIEIGAVKLDAQFRQISKFSVYIRPKLYPILSGHIAAVTKRLQQSLKYGLLFPDAAREFLAWCGDDYLFCTWTESDTATLKMNLKFYQLDDQLARCLDVQYVFSAQIEKTDMQRSIEYAVDYLRLPKSQTFHQAVNDAWYTGLILREISSILEKEPGSSNLVERYAFDPNLVRSYQISLAGLATVEAAMLELQEQIMTCPACGLRLQRRLEWSCEGNKAEAAFDCPVHGPVRGKGRFRTRGKDLLQASVTIRLDRDQES
jgi:inhibitor of KinA sporulation pathway (predicted exonuclease)